MQLPMSCEILSWHSIYKTKTPFFCSVMPKPDIQMRNNAPEPASLLSVTGAATRSNVSTMFQH